MARRGCYASPAGAYSVARVRYSFYVHRTAPRWRLVIAESWAFPERTTHIGEIGRASCRERV